MLERGSSKVPVEMFFENQFSRNWFSTQLYINQSSQMPVYTDFLADRIYWNTMDVFFIVSEDIIDEEEDDEDNDNGDS